MMLLPTAAALALTLTLVRPLGADPPVTGVTLYEHDSFRGRSETFFSDDPGLGDNRIGNDRASSVKVAPGCTATLFKHANYRGPSTLLRHDSPALGGTAVGNDAVSSLKVSCEAAPVPAEPASGPGLAPTSVQVPQEPAPAALRPCDELGVRLDACDVYECDVESRITGERATRRILGEKKGWCTFVAEQTDTHSIECRLSEAERYSIGAYFHSSRRAADDVGEDQQEIAGREQLEKALADDNVCRFVEGEQTLGRTDLADRIAVEKTIWDMQRLGRAMMLWMMDRIIDGDTGQARGEQPSATWRVSSEAAETSYSAISLDEITGLLVPRYIQKIPDKDGWGNPFQFALNGDFLDSNVVAIRSPGRDGRFDTDNYVRIDDRFIDDSAARRRLFENYDRDVLWADGFLNPQDHPLSFGGPAVTNAKEACNELGAKLLACEEYECESFGLGGRFRILGEANGDCVYVEESLFNGGSIECKYSESARTAVGKDLLLQSFFLGKVVTDFAPLLTLPAPGAMAPDQGAVFTALLPEGNSMMGSKARQGAQVAKEERMNKCKASGVNLAVEKTASDMNNTGMAMMSWLVDRAANGDKNPLADESLGSWRVRARGTVTSYRWISRQALTELLIPRKDFFYIDRVPERDGWGHPYQFAINDDLLGTNVLGIRSPGRDGRFDSDEYLIDKRYDNYHDYALSFVGDEDRDLVWLDGYFVGSAADAMATREGEPEPHQQ